MANCDSGYRSSYGLELDLNACLDVSLISCNVFGSHSLSLNLTMLSFFCCLARGLSFVVLPEAQVTCYWIVSSRDDMENEPMKSQQYGCLNKTSIMITPDNKPTGTWSHSWRKSYRKSMTAERGRISSL